ncbi:MAG: hypothetical protein WCK05_02875 [Planctomycetota bacterium]
MRPRPSSRSGFVLLMTLVLVILACTLLAGVARRSSEGAMESKWSAEELQRRWAVASCQATLLGRAEELLDEAERGQPDDRTPEKPYLNKPAAQRRVACRLAGLDYELVLTDEQAKLNANFLVQASSRGGAQSAVSQLITCAGLDASAVQLRTLVAGQNATKDIRGLLTVGGYGQVFPDVAPDRLTGREEHAGLADWVTCWGDGHVNIRRAPAAVVQRACEKVLEPNTIRTLLAVRDRDPYRPLSAMLDDLDRVDAKEKTKIAERFTDRSKCHGLWVIARGPQRSWYELAVGVGEKQEPDTRYRFAW